MTDLQAGGDNRENSSSTRVAGSNDKYGTVGRLPLAGLKERKTRAIQRKGINTPACNKKPKEKAASRGKDIDEKKDLLT